MGSPSNSAAMLRLLSDLKAVKTEPPEGVLAQGRKGLQMKRGLDIAEMRGTRNSGSWEDNLLGGFVEHSCVGEGIEFWPSKRCERRSRGCMQLAFVIPPAHAVLCRCLQDAALARLQRTISLCGES